MALRGATGAGTGVLAAATGCGASTGKGDVAPPANLGSGAPIDVVFMRTTDPSGQATYNAQADAFNKKQTRIRGRFEPATLGAGETWTAKLLAMLAADAAPDCFLVMQPDLAGWAATNVLLTLDPYIKRDAKEVNMDDFFATHVAAGKWKGKQVTLTPDGCAILEYYNLTLFQEAGVPTPKATWTWNDYLDAARKLTKKDGNGTVVQAGLLPLGFGPTDVNPFEWLWSNGANILIDVFKQVRVTEPQAIEAVQFVVDLIQKHGVATSSPGVDLGANPQVAGRVGMWRGVRGFFGNLQDVTSFKFNVLPVPRSPRTNQSVTVATPGHIGIAAGNKHPDAAWEWHKYLVSTEALVIRSKVQAGGCPSRKSATLDPSYMDYGVKALESTSGNRAFFDVLSDPKMVGFAPNYVAMSDALSTFNRYALAASKGEQSVPAAMTSAKAEIEDLLRRKPQP